MPHRLQMSKLVELCQQQCDKVGDDSVEAPEWKSKISLVYGPLWMAVDETGLRYFETSTTITANGAASYTEPSDHLSTIEVCRVLDAAGREQPLDELMHQEEHRLRGSTGDARYWTLVDDQLYLYPKPSSGTYIWRYVPQPTDLSGYADDDVVDVVTADGLQYLLWGVKILVGDKGESDIRTAMLERDRALERLVVWAANRALSNPRRRVAANGGRDPAEWMPPSL